ncbi:MAG: alanine--tRNA ligase [Ruminococcaceae bacterium]|nr:alanine--tRNA ligase [Oscillospiraceae bacterium]
MEKLSLNTIREKYLAFFETKQHLRLPSFSLVPQNDPSLLLINAGMAPLKPYFLGTQTPPSKRVTTCQKCIRTPDIDNVGKTARHGTFFEMLGNFSFGDYFKKEAITWAWEFLTEIMEIPGEKLWVTIYEDDDEAFDIWTKVVGLPEYKIKRQGKEDNFWELGLGPCGPDSEIHYDRGEKYGCGKPDCGVGCDCDRFIEIWNLVFTQFDQQKDGSYLRLAHPNIDTGMGLERLACVMQDVDNMFEVDTIRKIIDTVCELSGKNYGDDAQNDVSIRVITDHIRSTVMMISDGVIPSNEGKGYVLRRLLRGAARHGKKLGIQGQFLYELCDVAIELSCGAYPELKEKQAYIKKVIKTEEDRFASTIEAGMNMLDGYISDIESKGADKVLPGDVAFKLHDTYGFPLDLTRSICEEQGISVDEDGFRAQMNIQKQMARDAIKRDTSWANKEVILPKECPATVFEGYEKQTLEATVLYIVNEQGEFVQEAQAGENVVIVCDKTPFYATSGGQAADTGIIENDYASIVITDTAKTEDGKFKHMGNVAEGTVAVGQSVTMTIDKAKRFATECNHSATHLLQKALRTVLGEHVHQAGSSVSCDRLRFDFNHLQAVTKEELAQVEEIVNQSIYDHYDVVTKVMDVEDAKKSGAMALFGEKYGKNVRVVNMGEYSVELCGGTHVKNTSAIGLFKITHESAVAAGVRRIEAVTGNVARNVYKSYEMSLAQTAEILKADYADVPAKATDIIATNKQLTKELDQIKKEAAGSNLDDIIKNAKVVNGVSIVAARFDALGADGLREMCEAIRDKLDCGVALAASGADGKVTIVAMATKSAVEKKINCSMVVKKAAAICQGGGGGRPDMAQAGGKAPEKIDEMISRAEEFIS